MNRTAVRLLTGRGRCTVTDSVAQNDPARVTPEKLSQTTARNPLKESKKGRAAREEYIKVIDTILQGGTRDETLSLIGFLAGRLAVAQERAAELRPRRGRRVRPDALKAVTLPVAARLRGIKLWDLREASRTGELAVIRRGRRIYVRLGTLDALLERLELEGRKWKAERTG